MSNRSLVIVPVDTSRDAERTVAFAVNVARQRRADLHAIQVVRRDGELWLAPEEETTLRTRLRSLRPLADAEGVRLRIVTVRGVPEKVIPAYAQLNAAGLIVIGHTYGSSRFWRNTTVASRVIRSSPVPVVVLPAGFDGRPRQSLNRIVAGVDFTVASAVALRAAVDLARQHEARLTIVHAMDPIRRMVFSGGEAWHLVQRLPAEARRIADQLRTKALALGAANAEPVVVTGHPARGILDTAAERAADLVVIGIARRTWLGETAFGSTLRSVLRRVEIPVLVLPVVAGAHAWIDHASATWDTKLVRAPSGSALRAAPGYPQ